MKAIPNDLSAPETIAQQIERYDQIASMSAIVSELWTGVSDEVREGLDAFLSKSAADVQQAAHNASDEAERLPQCLSDADKADCLHKARAHARDAARSLTAVWQSYA